MLDIQTAQILYLAQEDAHMPVVAEKGSSSTEQDVAPDQKEEAKAQQSIFPISSFRKTLRNDNYLQDLELPAAFVKENGHNFQKAVSLQGPSGCSTVVHLKIQSYPLQDRVHFGRAGWKAFVMENGIKVGHQLLFSLVSMSTFTVRLLDSFASPPQNSLSVELSNGISNETSSSHAPAKIKRHRQQLHSHVIQASGMSPPKLRSDDVPVPANVKNDVVYSVGTVGFKREVEALLENLRCPHFVTVMKKSNLRDLRSCSLSIPVEFQKKYGAYFSKFNYFQGPSGRMVEVCFSGTGYDRFAKGWKAFHKENGFKLGDVLLLSLRAPACWLVQVVGIQSEDLRESYDSCDLK